MSYFSRLKSQREKTRSSRSVPTETGEENDDDDEDMYSHDFEVKYETIFDQLDSTVRDIVNWIEYRNLYSFPSERASKDEQNAFLIIENYEF
ncbi:unnamed protein product [Caenorhabditis angaria]|uniref:Uncharacterized protein n=1 Tax=Caenorhabditis angaria TaxID=860376 RepID=A0A9P1I7K0_9PELO|nr:unnamed protein product [Caenorhabditis angaria]